MGRPGLKNRLLPVSLAALILVHASAEARRWHHGICLFGLADVANPPRFEDYPASPHNVARPAAPVLSNASARRFRTMLGRGAAEGPNFAGDATVVTWGCGSSCIDFAIVDARSGRVSFAEQLRYLWHGHVDDDHALVYRGDSRLLAVLGMPHEDERREGILFFEWTGHSLRLLRSVPAHQLCGSRT